MRDSNLSRAMYEPPVLSGDPDRGQSRRAAEELAAFAAAGPKLGRAEFEAFSHWLRQTCGIDLKEGKEQLVHARLQKQMREGQFESFGRYFESVRRDATGQSLTALLNALTTNHTSFLRERAHFDFLCRTIAPQFSGTRRARIWSAACSTGQEPYSAAFSLLAEEALAAGSFEIFATDLSTKALDAARQCTYTTEQCAELPAEWLPRFFLRGREKWAGWYRVKPAIAQHIEFCRMNLIEPFPSVGRFDLILCRNVMIYFSKSTQQDLIARLTECLEPGGYLFVGHAESLTGIPHTLRYVQPAIWRKEGR